MHFTLVFFAALSLICRLSNINGCIIRSEICICNKDEDNFFELACENIDETESTFPVIELKTLVYSEYAKAKTIIFRNKNCKKLPDYAFLNITNIYKLVLSFNRIEQIEPFTFHGLSDMRNLDLSSNLIKEIPSGFRLLYLAKLEALSLSSNKIYQTEKLVFKGLTRLRELKLFQNELELIKNETFVGLNELETLDLRQNKIEILDSNTLKGLFKLKNLLLKRNRIKYLKSPFSDQNALTELDLSDQNLEVLKSDTFFGLNKLTTLNLSSSKGGLVEIEPNAFRGLLNLKTLNIYPNKDLKYLSNQSFADLGQLTKLDLRNMSLQMLCTEVFAGLKNLNTLIVSYSNISEIEPNAFKGCKCTDVQMRYNPIQILHGRSFLS